MHVRAPSVKWLAPVAIFEAIYKMKSLQFPNVESLPLLRGPTGSLQVRSQVDRVSIVERVRPRHARTKCNYFIINAWLRAAKSDRHLVTIISDILQQLFACFAM
jgi:hypothetical protein